MSGDAVFIAEVKNLFLRRNDGNCLKGLSVILESPPPFFLNFIYYTNSQM